MTSELSSPVCPRCGYTASIASTPAVIPPIALRPKQAARALGISERKLREILPELPHVRIGGAVVIPVQLLKKWLVERADADTSRADRATQQILDALGSSEG